MTYDSHDGVGLVVLHTQKDHQLTDFVKGNLTCLYVGGYVPGIFLETCLDLVAFFGGGTSYKMTIHFNIKFDPRNMGNLMTPGCFLLGKN